VVLECSAASLFLSDAYPVPAIQPEIDPDSLVCLRLCRLHSTRAVRTLSSDRFEVNRCCVHLDIVERELRALRKDPSIECDQRASIVVETISVAALLICVEIDTPKLRSASETERTNLLRSFLDEIYPSVQFTQLVMTARRVCEDFHPV